MPLRIRAVRWAQEARGERSREGSMLAAREIDTEAEGRPVRSAEVRELLERETARASGMVGEDVSEMTTAAKRPSAVVPPG